MTRHSSRLLSRLEAEIARVGDGVHADCVRAERAIYLARMGDLAEARRAVHEIRSRYAERPRAEVSAWLALAEGLARYYESVSDAARDQILRAQALASAAGLARLEALSSVWLAHLDFGRLSADTMRKNVDRALGLCEPRDHSVVGRVAMVVAYSLHFANLADLARPWYRTAHWHATQEGDLSSISALLHNLASFRLSEIRLAHFRQGINPSGEAQLLLAAESNQHFDEFVGAKALNFLTPLLKSQVLVLVGRFEEAIPAFDTHLESGRGADRFRALYLAERAWSHLQLERRDSAEADALASAELAGEGQADDRAACCSRLSEVFLGLGNESASRLHALNAEQAWSEHEAVQRKFASAFETLRMPPGLGEVI